MMQISEFSDEHLVRSLRSIVNDLSDKHSPFPKDEAYLRNLAGWIACAATRLEKLSKSKGEKS